YVRHAATRRMASTSRSASGTDTTTSSNSPPELWEDPEYRESVIVEEPSVFGVEQLSDSSLVFRVSAKTLPARQAEVARELRLRVKAALDAAGIAIAP
ncbi:hypothetical protein AB0K48_17355, partial [Nonomuraea sp. NPDC055795]